MNTIISPEPSASDYPVVMINKYNDTVVMFTDHRIGMVIACSDHAYSVGHCSNKWTMTNFSFFTGSITIQAVNGK